MELTEPVKNFLSGKDVEFRRLAARHKDLSDKLEMFVHRADLGEAEQQEERLIKKEKLSLKDQMIAIARKYSDELAKLPA